MRRAVRSTVPWLLIAVGLMAYGIATWDGLYAYSGVAVFLLVLVASTMGWLDDNVPPAPIAVLFLLLATPALAKDQAPAPKDGGPHVAYWLGLDNPPPAASKPAPKVSRDEELTRLAMGVSALAIAATLYHNGNESASPWQPGDGQPPWAHVPGQGRPHPAHPENQHGNGHR